MVLALFVGRSLTNSRGTVLRYLFDLTTSAHWGGAAVGITRVEQGLARRARQCLGDGVTFCIYDKYRNLFLAIDDETAAKAIEGTLQIKIQPPSGSRGDWRRFDGARRVLRRAVLSNASVYHAFQHLLGRSFTRQEVLQIRQRELAVLSPQEARPLPPTTPVTLDADTVVISGGLDWEHKDLRALWALKQQYKFQYCAVVYDLIPILFPHYLVRGYIELLTEYFGELYWLADRVMCISVATRRDWLRYCDELGGQVVPAQVFPLGCDLQPAAPGAVAEMPMQLADKRYVLFVSTIEPRKNHRMIYEAWDDCVRNKLVDTQRDRLVFVGRRGWAVEELLSEISLNPATRDTIVILNNVDDAQLSLVYQNSAFVVFPSHYEGFGLPVAEALGHGKPCISSNAGALPEIGDDLVVRLDAKDTPAWARTIAHYMRSPDELTDWSQRIKRKYQTITWDMAAKIFFARIAENAR
jgi:glycosyltransferase involved in cell wall biosynthesis